MALSMIDLYLEALVVKLAVKLVDGVLVHLALY